MSFPMIPTLPVTYISTSNGESREAMQFPDYIRGMLQRFSNFQKRIGIGLAVGLLIWPMPVVMGEITKRNLTNKCDFFFQNINKDLKKAEQTSQSWKYFNDASYFAYQFTITGTEGSVVEKECLSLINPRFRERVISFYAALIEHNRIQNTFGTNAPPPSLPYSSNPEGSVLFRASCESPTPLLLKFKTECKFFEYLNINTYSYFE